MSEQAAGFVPVFDVHDRLRKARECAGLAQGSLAREMGVSRNTVVNYEIGATTHLKPIVIKAWAMRTGVSYRWLTTGTGGDGLPRLESNQQPSGYATEQVIAGPWAPAEPLEDVA